MLKLLGKKKSFYRKVLILDEGDGPVLSLNKDGVKEGKKKLDLCLIGKVIGARLANKEGIVKAMNGVWKINHQFQVEELNLKNMFWFFFGYKEDRLRSYKGGPWTIDNEGLINITKPLKRGLRVAVDDQGTKVSLIFQYDHLSDFCFDCGIIGHKVSQIIKVVKRGHVRYSITTVEELAPTSILEAREREEETRNPSLSEIGISEPRNIEKQCVGVEDKDMDGELAPSGDGNVMLDVSIVQPKMNISAMVSVD
ncbi:hypothetical protein F8388_003177 [Cannabis sativa]|uniref:DUF4283 domain-containing protein n=1 Tax=Cannabis sativa TaxID=3483 RepID=A0A7J6EEP7_CANSA|nr:hypothetical protein F8388_003177 [Cannabis sativa]